MADKQRVQDGQEGTPALVGLSPEGLAAVKAAIGITGDSKRITVERAVIVYAAIMEVHARIATDQTIAAASIVVDGRKWTVRSGHRRPSFWQRLRDRP